jgi:hypothetical protein
VLPALGEAIDSGSEASASCYGARLSAVLQL